MLNLQGRAFMAQIDCPFRGAEWALNKISQETKVVFVDFHAEATAEKQAMAFFLDGKVSAVVGTHTHVQTADEQILPGGTAYITDAGMTGGQSGVIGMDKESVFHRFLTGTPSKFEVCNDNIEVQGLVIEIDPASGKSLSVSRVSRY